MVHEDESGATPIPNLLLEILRALGMGKMSENSYCKSYKPKCLLQGYADNIMQVDWWLGCAEPEGVTCLKERQLAGCCPTIQREVSLLNKKLQKNAPKAAK